MNKVKMRIVTILLGIMALALGFAFMNLMPKEAKAEATGTPYYVVNQTDGVNVAVDHYNDCYKEGNLPGNAIIALDNKIGETLTFTTSGRVTNIKWAVYVEKQGDVYKATKAGTFGAVGEITSSGGVLTFPQDGYILLAKGTAWTTELQKIAVGDEVSYINVSEGYNVLTDETYKQSLYISATNALADNATTVYTHGWFEISSSTVYRMVYAAYDFSTDKYEAKVVETGTATTATKVHVPQGWIIIVRTGTNDISYAKPLAYNISEGDVLEYKAYKPTVANRGVKDETTGKNIYVDFYNDYYKDTGNIPNMTIIALDRKVTTDGKFAIRNGAGKNLIAVLVTGDGNGNYTATDGAITPTNSDATNYEFTIPEDGYLLLARGAVKKTLLCTVKAGDVMTGLTERKPENAYELYNETYGYHWDVSTPLNEVREDGVSVMTEGAYTITDTYQYITATYNYDTEKYEVQASARGTGAEVAVPESGILILINRYSSFDNDYYYAKPGMLHTSEGNIIDFAGFTPSKAELPAVDMTIEGVRVDGINPTTNNYNTKGKIIVYTSTEMREQNTNYGATVNMPYRVTTFARPTESRVKNYLVVLIKSGDGYKHIVSEIKDGKEEITIPYNGYVISIPEGANGYGNFNVGDELEVGGVDASFRLPNYIVDNITENVRIEINGVNETPTYSGFIILYNDQFGATDPMSAWRQRVIVSEQSRVTGEVIYGSTKEAVDIPVGGFVLTANGANAGCVQLSLFDVDDEVAFYNVYEETDTTLATIKLNGEEIRGYDYNRYQYNVYIPKGDAIPELFYESTQLSANVSVTTPTSIPGSFILKVTAKDNITVNSYIVNVYYDLDKNTNVEDVVVNGKVWNNFDDSLQPNYYYIEKGTELPIIAATAESLNASVVCTQASAENKTAIVKIVAEDNSFSKEYTIIFVEVDLTLTEIKVGDETLLLTESLEYNVKLEEDAQYYPVVSAVSTDKSCRLVMTQASGTKNYCTISVSNYGLNKEYKVTFAIGEQTVIPDGSLENGGLKPWQITLIVGVSIMVVLAVGGVVALSLVKKKEE